MSPTMLTLLALGIFAIAFLYSSVGHAGASGYIAVMSLFGLAPEVIKPTALTLNILVASLAAWQFWRAGYFSWRLFWPFALLAAPFAFLGGYLNLPARAFNVMIGVILIFSAARLFQRPPADVVAARPSRPAALGIGAGIGLVAGLSGTGGGIFLTPILVLKQWALARTAAAVSALFILMNSMAGLAGNISGTRQFPLYGLWFLAVAGAGGAIGAYAGSRRFDPVVIKRLLAVVLVIAGAKLLFTV